MIGIVILSATGLFISIILALIDSSLKKTKTDQFLDFLPGYNCGACGFGSCAGMSEAMKDNIDNYKKCKPLRGEALEKMQKFVENYK